VNEEACRLLDGEHADVLNWMIPRFTVTWRGRHGGEYSARSANSIVRADGGDQTALGAAGGELPFEGACQESVCFGRKSQTLEFRRIRFAWSGTRRRAWLEETFAQHSRSARLQENWTTTTAIAAGEKNLIRHGAI